MTQKNQTNLNPLKITDTTFRDAHQSLFATRMRTADMEAIAPEMDGIGFYSMEVWGGATFDVTTRFLAEDPWERVRSLKKLMPNTPLQMLLRGQNLVGYRNYPDDVVRAFVRHAAEVGIDIFRVFDALNNEENFQTAVETIKETGKHFQACICYSVTEEGRLGGPVYNLEYFIKKALVFQDMGADSLCIKDMAGLLAPYDAYELVKALKTTLTIPVQLHTHYTSGMASMTSIKAIEAGLDILDACLAPFALRTAQPAVEPIIVTLQGTEWNTGLDLNAILKVGDYMESIAPKYQEHMESPRTAVIDATVLSHQIPGGMTSNLLSQLREADALDRLNEVLQELPMIRRELGYPPLVTPASQIVGTQAVSNVLFGRYKMITQQVKDYVYGLYGKPPAQIDPDISKLVLQDYERGQTPITGRAADFLEPEMDAAKEATQNLAKDIGDVLIYALYPVTGLRFLRMKSGLEPVPPDMQPKTLEQAQEEEERVTRARAGLLTETASLQGKSPRSIRARMFSVSVGDQLFQVEVDSAGKNPGLRPASTIPSQGPALPVKAASFSAASSSQADPKPVTAAEGEIAVRAPMPGIVSRYTVEVGQRIKTRETVVILEAMKMENALPSPVDGVVRSLNGPPGTKVAKDEVLVIIET